MISAGGGKITFATGTDRYEAVKTAVTDGRNLRMTIPKYEYVMDYIDDPKLFKAVNWASQMIREGKHPSIAIRKASHYYHVDMKDVSHYIGQRGGRRNAERWNRNEP